MAASRWLGLLSALALIACAEGEPRGVEGAQGGAASQSQEAAALDRVETERVAPAVIRTSMTASGSIRARRVSEIGADVSGRLVRVFVDVGDDVKEGDPLFQIDARPYEMGLAEARAGLALARAESENAEQEMRRVSRLIEQRIASEQHFEQLQTAASVARAQVAQMEARVARAERDLECTLVRAPYPGSIVERNADEGAMAGPAPILMLQETGSLEAVLAIPDAWPAPVRSGAEVRLYVEGLSEPLVTRIDRVSDRVDPETHTYEVRGPVDDPSRTAKAGSYLRAEIETSTDGSAPAVDRSAILNRDGRSFVFRVSGDTVERVPVRIGVVGDDRVQILSGVASGDEVVRGEAVARLESGARIERIAELSARSAGAEGTP
jgi:RND family efflux transporter MFP subunit